MKSLITKTRTWYVRFERPISSLSLIAGFCFDAFTLKRVDMFWENFWVVGHLIIVGIFIVLIHVKESVDGDEKDPSKAHFWFVNILQFFFGGLLSTFLVFYFRSADFFVSWPFLLLLALAFLANESLKRHYVKFSFQISLFFLSIYSFAIFLLPVLMHQIGPRIFLFSGLVSLVFIVIFVGVIFIFIRNRLKESKRLIIFLILSIFFVVNLLYFTNIIPPIPLSLKDGGIFHDISRNIDGNYDVTYEDAGWKGYFQMYPIFNEVAGDPVYAYSAIFSPTNLNITVLHEWQHYDVTQKKWLTDFTLNLKVVGGRDGGFRTYSERSNLTPGKWRVNIKTQEGQVIGTLRFNVVSVNTEPTLISGIR